MAKHDLILKPDLSEPTKLATGSSELHYEFTARKKNARTYQLWQGDTIVVEVRIEGDFDDFRKAEIHQMNGVCWPAPGAKDQFFTTAFRCDADNPDAQILAQGSAAFKKIGNDDRAYEMTFPASLLCLRAGRFSFVISLTLRIELDNGETRFQTYITDPEMDVEGSGGGGGPIPGSRLER